MWRLPNAAENVIYYAHEIEYIKRLRKQTSTLVKLYLLHVHPNKRSHEDINAE